MEQWNKQRRHQDLLWQGKLSVSVRPWTKFYLETLSPGLHVCYFDKNQLAGKAHRFIATAVASFSRYNVPCHIAIIVQLWFEKQNKEFKEFELTFQILLISIQLSICGVYWTNNSIHEGPTSRFLTYKRIIRQVVLMADLIFYGIVYNYMMLA